MGDRTSLTQSSLAVLLCIPVVVLGQLKPRLCTLRSSPGILIQQVDKDWNKVPFDCKNIEVLIIGDAFEQHIKPGQLHGCKYRMAPNEDAAIAVLGETSGVYDVLIKRFDEESYFQNVEVVWDDSGCDVIGQLLEVQIDMNIKAKK